MRVAVVVAGALGCFDGLFGVFDCVRKYNLTLDKRRDYWAELSFYCMLHAAILPCAMAFASRA